MHPYYVVFLAGAPPTIFYLGPDAADATTALEANPTAAMVSFNAIQVPIVLP